MKITARSSLHTIHGRGTGLRGYLDAAFWGDGLRPDAPVRMHLDIPVAKLESGNPAQDREMHRLMSSRAFPNIEADLVEATLTGRPNHYAVAGSVAVRGSTRKIAAEISLRQRDGRVEIDGERTIDVNAFGIKPPRIFMFEVYPEVTIGLHVVAMLAQK